MYRKFALLFYQLEKVLIIRPFQRTISDVHRHEHVTTKVKAYKYRRTSSKVELSITFYYKRRFCMIASGYTEQV